MIFAGRIILVWFFVTLAVNGVAAMFRVNADDSPGIVKVILINMACCFSALTAWVALVCLKAWLGMES